MGQSQPLGSLRKSRPKVTGGRIVLVILFAASTTSSLVQVHNCVAIAAEAHQAKAVSENETPAGARARIREALERMKKGDFNQVEDVLKKDSTFSIEQLALLRNRAEVAMPTLEYMCTYYIGQLGSDEEGRLADESAVGALIECLYSGELQVSRKAAQYLQTIDVEKLSIEDRSNIITAFRESKSPHLALLLGVVGGNMCLSELKDHENVEARELRDAVRVALARLGDRRYESDILAAYKAETGDPRRKVLLIGDLSYVATASAIETLGDDIEMKMMTEPLGDPEEYASLPVNNYIFEGLAAHIPDFPLRKPHSAVYTMQEVSRCARWWRENKARILNDLQAREKPREREYELRDSLDRLNSVRGETGLLWKEISNKNWRDYGALVETAKRILDETRSARYAFLDIGELDVSTHYPIADVGAPLEFLPVGLAAFRLFTIEAELHRTQQDMRGALDAYCHAIDAARSLGHLKFAIGAAASFSCERRAWCMLRDFLQEGPIPKDLLAYAEDKVVQLGETPLSLEDCLITEVDLMKKSLERMPVEEFARVLMNSGIRIERELRKEDLSSDLTNYELHVVEWLRSGPSAKNYDQEPRPATEVMNQWMPHFAGLSVDKDLTEAELGLTSLTISLLRYFAEHRRLPDDLSFLTKVPVDPFSGVPLQYVKRPDGCLIYSVGPDGDDDRGELIYTDKAAAGALPGDGDVVFRVTRKDE